MCMCVGGKEGRAATGWRPKGRASKAGQGHNDTYMWLPTTRTQQNNQRWCAESWARRCSTVVHTDRLHRVPCTYPLSRSTRSSRIPTFARTKERPFHSLL